MYVLYKTVFLNVTIEHNTIWMSQLKIIIFVTHSLPLVILIQQLVTAFKQVLPQVLKLYEKYVKQFGTNCSSPTCQNPLRKYEKKLMKDSIKNWVS